jgi:predicted esterase
MHRALPLVFLLLAVCLPAGVGLGVACADKQEPAAAPVIWNGVKSAPEVKEKLKAYFDADEDERAGIRAFLDALGTLKPTDVSRFTKAICKEMKKHGPKIGRKSGFTFTHGSLSGPVYTSGKPKRKHPLLIALHGGGQGAGDGKNALQKWGSAKAFVLAPTAPELRNSAWNQPDIEQYVLALIEAAKRSFDIDTDRIYVAGHSMGGYGTWSLGCRHADRFAALAPCAGGVFMMRGGAGDSEGLAPGHIPNLLNTPIRFFHSTDDKQVPPHSDQAAHRFLTRLKEKGYAYEWIYEEYDDIGHGLPPKGLGPIIEWLLEKKRVPHPKHVVWEPTRPYKQTFYWLGGVASGRIEGRIDGNTVTLDGRTSGVTVYLGPELVDVKKPVLIRSGDKTLFEGMVQPRLSVLLDTLAQRRDKQQCYAYAVTLP